MPQNRLRIGVNKNGMKIAGVIFAVFTFVAPRKLVPIRTIISEPVAER